MAVHGFEAGQLVVCRYRLPSELQPWIHDVHIGEVVEPGDDPAAWNGHNSERSLLREHRQGPGPLLRPDLLLYLPRAAPQRIPPA